ncbi:MAG: hypothetical protein EON56_00475 [Alphaproteobacteria bacterium]|nr:MAG: hypothetical protein EON56_00475 [Alphaproteobacteria bacterium]
MSRLPLLLLAWSLAASARADDFDALERKALAGAYQAQRNVAYWLTGGNAGAPPNNPVLECAWRLAILKSVNKQVDAGDVSNKQLYCEKRLHADAQRSARAQADTLIVQIAKGKK